MDLENPKSRIPNPKSQGESEAESQADYCKQLEDYLCKVNGGHLVRIVGPAFEQVCGWATRGVPLNVARRGVDRYCERDRAKGPRRRPVRIEFCEADVLDVFDEWRRAIGVSTWDTASAVSSDASALLARRDSLPAHLERVVTRLTALRTSENQSLSETIDGTVRELDVARASAKSLRGDARAALIQRLQALDEALLTAVRDRTDADTLRGLELEADAELAPFRDRMPADAYAQSQRACVDRLLRERARLPVLTFDV